MKRDELTQLLSIAEKLLTLAESQAENDLDSTRNTARFRRENVLQLDRIEEKIGKLKTVAPVEETFLTTKQAKTLWVVVKHIGPWALTAAVSLFHLLAHLTHH